MCRRSLVDVDRGAPEHPTWAVVVANPLEVRGSADKALPPHRTRWIALGALLLVGLSLIGVGTVVRRGVATAPSGRVAPVQLRPGSVQGEPGAPYAVTWVGVDGHPVRWNPCRAIRWVNNPGAAPAGSLEETQAAFARLAAATGIQFEYAGETDEAPVVEREEVQARYGDGWAPILVAWAPLNGTPLGAGLGTMPDTEGVSTPAALSRPGDPSVIVSAQVVLESGRTLLPGFGSSESRGAVILHELAHALGLGHVPDPSQLMFVGNAMVSGPGELQAGDLAGLAALGRSGGCVPEPDPSTVD